jgi:hypothetical protein
MNRTNDILISPINLGGRGMLHIHIAHVSKYFEGIIIM